MIGRIRNITRRDCRSCDVDAAPAVGDGVAARGMGYEASSVFLGGTDATRELQVPNGGVIDIAERSAVVFVERRKSVAGVPIAATEVESQCVAVAVEDTLKTAHLGRGGIDLHCRSNHKGTVIASIGNGDVFGQLEVLATVALFEQDVDGKRLPVLAAGNQVGRCCRAVAAGEGTEGHVGDNLIINNFKSIAKLLTIFIVIRRGMYLGCCALPGHHRLKIEAVVDVESAIAVFAGKGTVSSAFFRVALIFNRNH